MLGKLKQGAETIKAINRLRQIQKQLSQERITVEEAGVRVVVSGDMKIRELESNGKSDDEIIKAVNRAFSQAQKVVAKKMQEMGGGLGGLLGGLT